MRLNETEKYWMEVKKGLVEGRKYEKNNLKWAKEFIKRRI